MRAGRRRGLDQILGIPTDLSGGESAGGEEDCLTSCHSYTSLTMVKTPGFFEAPPANEPLITAITFISLAAVIALLAIAHLAGKAVLPSRVRQTDRAVFVWLVS